MKTFALSLFLATSTSFAAVPGVICHSNRGPGNDLGAYFVVIPSQNAAFYIGERPKNTGDTKYKITKTTITQAEVNEVDVVHTKYTLNSEEFFFDTDFMKGTSKGKGEYTRSVGGMFGIFTQYETCQRTNALSDQILETVGKIN